MKNSFAIFLTLIFAVSACTPAAQAEDFTPTPQQRIESPLIVSVIDSGHTPTPPPTSNLLPTFSFSSPSTVDVSSLPTFDPSALPTPLPNTTSSAIQTPYFGSPDPNADCFATASSEGLHLNPGPFISAYRLSPTMEPGVRYRVIDKYGTFFQLTRDSVPVGWIEFPIYTTGYSTEGPDCAGFFNRPPDTRVLTDFSGLCFFTVNRSSQMFLDSALTEPAMRFGPSPQALVALWKSRKSIFTSLSHAGPSFYSPTDHVSIFGDCAGIPTSATVTTAGWLRSKPDESQGEKLLQLTVSMQLHIEGNRPPDSSGEAAWVQAVVDIDGKNVSGWVWSGLLTFD